MLNYNIGKRIRHLRTELRISQEQLALCAEITPAYLGQIERSEKNPTVRVIAKISDIFGMTLSEFFADPAPEAQPAKAGEAYVRQLVFEMRELAPAEQRELLKLVRGIVRFRHLGEKE